MTSPLTFASGLVLRNSGCAEAFNHPAIRNPSALADIQHALQLGAERHELSNALVDRREVSGGNPVDRGAWLVGLPT